MLFKPGAGEIGHAAAEVSIMDLIEGKGTSAPDNMLSVACTFYELRKSSKLQIKQPCKIHQQKKTAGCAAVA